MKTDRLTFKIFEYDLQSISNDNWSEHQGDSKKVSSLSQISAEILLKSKILVSAEILLKLRFTKGISAETKISAKF